MLQIDNNVCFLTLLNFDSRWVLPDTHTSDSTEQYTINTLFPVGDPRDL